MMELNEGAMEMADMEPAPKAASKWSMDEIRQAIGELPEGYRLVFTLYLIEGYDHKEIGIILNISEATSKSQFSRAKRKVRELLHQSRYVSAEMIGTRSLKRTPMPNCA